MPRPHNPEYDLRIARMLNEADGAFVSGERLGEDLGVSRVTVLNRVRALRARGFLIDGRHRLGYAMRGVPRYLDESALMMYSKFGYKDGIFRFFDVVPSTNSEVERQLDSVEDGRPVVAFARRQTAGRGRRGRVWLSDSMDSLYLSFGFKPKIVPGRMGCFTLWMGLCLAMAVEGICGIVIGVKWPNDLVAENGAKLAGVLTEARVDSESVRQLVVGIGVNVNTGAGTLRKVKDREAQSLRGLAGTRADLNRVGAAVMDGVLDGYTSFVSGDFKDTFRIEWRRRDALRGKRVSVDFQGSTIEGIAEGIGHEGELLVRGEDGVLRGITAGDATVLRQD